MGIFLSLGNVSKELSNSQKIYQFTSPENNEIIVNPSDFRAFVRVFRGLQSKKEDAQIELRNIVLEWKSRLRFNQETQEIRTEAYELIESVENLHDEQDAILESEDKKLQLLTREEMLRNGRLGHEKTRWGSEEEILIENDEREFDEIRKDISKRRQYLQIFNKQSTHVLKLALVDIEACQKMVDYSKDFKGSGSDEELSCTDDEVTLPHPV